MTNRARSGRPLLAPSLLAAVLLLKSCGVGRADPGSDPRFGAAEVTRGDEWTYEIRDTLTGDVLSEESVVVVEKHADSIDTRLRVTGAGTGINRSGAATFDLYWRKLPDEISPGSGAQESWGLRPNLRVGDDWGYGFERPILGSAIMMRWIGHGEALGLEPLELPNGRTVQTLKLEFFERPAVARYRFEMHVIEWYSPEMNRYVQRDVETKLDHKVTESTTELLQDYIHRP